MRQDVLGLDEIDRSQIALVGGKGANLGELSRMEGVSVPAGFCVTTDAFKRVAEAASIDDRLEQLSRLTAGDVAGIRALSAELRRGIEETAIPSDLASGITSALSRLGDQSSYAVRSSATAEDLPTASFAGQHDTYLNVVGPAPILQHVSRCWASLFTERAVTYRLRNGVDHRKAYMAVLVQRMLLPNTAGVLFTADPITGNRKVASVEASFGLGETLVSGLVSADIYKVRDEAVVAKTISRERPALSDEQVLRLVTVGRRIEAYFGRPQDIEWCLVGDEFHFVQSRPVTTLFPIPVADDGLHHVYVSVGHQQMMTDAMKPLGISVWQLTAGRPMHEAGGRMFVDVSRELASSAGRTGLLSLAKSDPLIGGALETIVERDFIPLLADESPVGSPTRNAPPPTEADPAIVAELLGRTEASLAALTRDIRAKSGPELLDFIIADFQELKRILTDPRSHQAIMAGMEATWWLNDHLHAWLGEKNAADTLAQSVPNNVTSEMGFALLDVADVIRPHPEVVAFLQRAEDEGFDEGFLDELPTIAGGADARDAIQGWLDKYGMRCSGEIDITRPRWSERPTTLIPLILSNVENLESGAGTRRFEQGRAQAQKKKEELLDRLRQLPDGERKSDEVERMIGRLRAFIGYREYPKYGIVRRYFIYKKALMEEAERLGEAFVLHEADDIFYLTLQEMSDIVRGSSIDDDLIARRKEAFRSYQSLTPPRVLTSEGEAISGSYRRDDMPAGALVGLPVSAGTVEGRARVILDMAQADLVDGDILVTTFTDPSWTPLFLAIKGLVTEVGGLMTHGAVIAREYGLPAVVGVEHATRLIRDGQRIRVHGTEGYIEILSPPSSPCS